MQTDHHRQSYRGQSSSYLGFELWEDGAEETVESRLSSSTKETLKYLRQANEHYLSCNLQPFYINGERKTEETMQKKTIHQQFLYDRHFSPPERRKSKQSQIREGTKGTKSAPQPRARPAPTNFLRPRQHRTQLDIEPQVKG